jgi:hypothetical protein
MPEGVCDEVGVAAIVEQATRMVEKLADGGPLAVRDDAR